jgi:hypothetical protein
MTEPTKEAKDRVGCNGNCANCVDVLCAIGSNSQDEKVAETNQLKSNLSIRALYNQPDPELEDRIRELNIHYLNLIKCRDDYTTAMVEPELTSEILSLLQANPQEPVTEPCPEYHLLCRECGYDRWSKNGFEECPICQARGNILTETNGTGRRK